MNNVSYLESGIYTPREAARLIGVSPNKIRGWVQGYPNTQADPIISNQLGKVDHTIALSFVNLIEALFIAQFSKHGIHVRSIRAMAEEAKNLLRSPHPFASEHIFKTDGKRIFAQIVTNIGDKKLTKLYDLKTHNWSFKEVLEKEFKQHVVYGPHGYAHLWYPKKKNFPNVLINPNVAFGQPVMAQSGIPTVTLYDSYYAEDKDAETVAKLFETTADSVQEAVRFERNLAKAA